MRGGGGLLVGESFRRGLSRRSEATHWADEEFQRFSDVPEATQREEPRTIDSRFQTLKEIMKGD